MIWYEQSINILYAHICTVQGFLQRFAVGSLSVLCIGSPLFTVGPVGSGSAAIINKLWKSSAPNWSCSQFVAGIGSLESENPPPQHNAITWRSTALLQDSWSALARRRHRAPTVAFLWTWFLQLDMDHGFSFLQHRPGKIIACHLCQGQCHPPVPCPTSCLRLAWLMCPKCECHSLILLSFSATWAASLDLMSSWYIRFTCAPVPTVWPSGFLNWQLVWSNSTIRSWSVAAATLRRL